MEMIWVLVKHKETLDETKAAQHQSRELSTNPQKLQDAAFMRQIWREVNGVTVTPAGKEEEVKCQRKIPSIHGFSDPLWVEVHFSE